MHSEWVSRFALHIHGSDVLELDSHQRIGVDWQLAQTQEGRLFALVRGNGSTEFGDDRIVLRTIGYRGAVLDRSQRNGAEIAEEEEP